VRTPPPDLIKVTEIFLVPSSFIVAALGTADTNAHRAVVSLLGLIVSLLWWVCSHEALHEPSEDAKAAERRHVRRVRILSWLPIVFAAGWLVSTVVHAWIWKLPLGQ
jgi:hypothetical protein